MEVVHPRCCGLDVHKRSISACVFIREHGGMEKLERRFCTFTRDLEDLAEWLAQHQVTHLAMEATGVYWKPVRNVLEGRVDLMLVNPQHVKALTGKKYDRRDAAHLADLLQHGLLQGSFIPTAEIRQLRDLTRNRARTVQEAARIKSRIQKVLEEANIKLGSVATDVLGVSGRLMLNGLVAGEQDGAKLADLAIGVLRKKHDQLVQALSGKVHDHHRLMLHKLLRALQTREAEIAQKTTPTSAARSSPSVKPCWPGCRYLVSMRSQRGLWSRRWDPTWNRLRQPNKLLPGLARQLRRRWQTG